MEQFNRSLKSFLFAWQGLKYAFVTQVNFKIQLIIGCLAAILAFFLEFNRIEWIILIFTVSLVLITELINTAVEIIVDYLFPGYHETAGKIKDISAAAVLVSAIAAIIAGLMLFLPKIIDLRGFHWFQF